MRIILLSLLVFLSGCGTFKKEEPKRVISQQEIDLYTNRGKRACRLPLNLFDHYPSISKMERAMVLTPTAEDYRRFWNSSEITSQKQNEQLDLIKDKLIERGCL